MKNNTTREITETMEMLKAILKMIPQDSESEEWNDIKAQTYHELSMAQTVLASYDDAIESARIALTLFRKSNQRAMIASVLNNLGRVEYYRANYHKALDFYNDSLTLRRELDDKKGIAASLNNIGLIYHAIENYTTALKYYEESLALKRELNDESGIASTLNNIGLIHVLLGEYSKAIECYMQSLKMRNPLREAREIANIQVNIGEVYLALGDTYNALRSFEESLKISREVKDKRREAIALNGIGKVYEATKEYDVSLTYYQESLRNFEEIGLQNSTATTLANIASIYQAKGDYNRAFEYYQQSLDRLQALGDQPAMAQTMVLMGKTLMAQKNYSLAKTFLNQALEAGEKLAMRRVCYEVFEQLALLYEHLKEFELAYRAHQKFHTIKETVFNEEQGKKIAAQRALFENELARQEAERHKQQNLLLTKALDETKRLKAIAEEANAFKTELLGIAAHDLKNPLQSIMGFSQIIQESKEDWQKIMFSAKAIEQSTKRMHRLIEDLLNNAKLDKNVIELKKSQADVAEILRSVVEQNRPSAEKKSQAIELNINGNSIADIDEERMYEVFDNLISNAIKYSPLGKRIVVKSEERKAGTPTGEWQTTLLIAIQDEGQGLTEEDKANLFGKFKRLSARPTGGEPSIGLGLSIVKHLVELHGGKVWAESEGKGRGTTFFVELPTGL
ncbi:MAG: tetratricopeptide repeat-containing sensor histidine kinase [Chloroherpetonaceae bacterium]